MADNECSPANSACSCFVAGALPLAMTLSPSQLRLISTIGMGVLVGTSLIVIIPEGIEAVYNAGAETPSSLRRGLQTRESQIEVSWGPAAEITEKAEDRPNWLQEAEDIDAFGHSTGRAIRQIVKI